MALTELPRVDIVSGVAPDGWYRERAARLVGSVIDELPGKLRLVRSIAAPELVFGPGAAGAPTVSLATEGASAGVIYAALAAAGHDVGGARCDAGPDVRVHVQDAALAVVVAAIASASGVRPDGERCADPTGRVRLQRSPNFDAPPSSYRTISVDPGQDYLSNGDADRVAQTGRLAATAVRGDATQAVFEMPDGRWRIIGLWRGQGGGPGCDPGACPEIRVVITPGRVRVSTADHDYEATLRTR